MRLCLSGSVLFVIYTIILVSCYLCFFLCKFLAGHYCCTCVSVCVCVCVCVCETVWCDVLERPV